MKKRISLFKNDPYGIKYKIFSWRLDRYIKSEIKVYTKCLRGLLLISLKMGIPTTKEEADVLRKVINSYDDTIEKLERLLTYKRACLKGMEEEYGKDKNRLV